MRIKQQIAAGMAIVFLVIFLISAVVVTNYFLESKKQEAVFQALEHIAEQETGSTSDKVDSSEEVRGPENSEYDTLSERNPDFWGWIKIDGTQLSYPVMYTPDDPEHYLRRDFVSMWSR